MLLRSLPLLQVYQGLKGTLYPCVVIRDTDTEVTVCTVDEGDVNFVSRPVAAALSLFICDLLISLTSKESLGMVGQDSVAHVKAARQVLLTEKGLARLFALGSSGVDAVASGVLNVLLNLLLEPEVVQEMLFRGQPMRLSALFMKLEVGGA